MLVLAGLIWFIENRIEKHAPQPMLGARLLAEPLDDVSYLIIETEALRIDCMRQDKTWMLKRPVETVADASAINRLLSVLENLTRDEVITAEECALRELRPADYGLENPRARVRLGNGAVLHDVLIGDYAPLGEHVYVKLAWSGDIVCIARALVDALPERVDEFRDRSVLRGDVAHTLRLEIHRPDAGFTQLSTVGGRWTIQQPMAARADSARVNAMLEAVYSAKVKTFVWDPIPGGSEEPAAVALDASSRIEAYGLGADEAVHISVWVKGDEIGTGLLLGKPVPDSPGDVYAKWRDAPSVFTVDHALTEAFAVSLGDLRDHAVLPLDPRRVSYAYFRDGDTKLVLERNALEGWRIREPVQRLADEELVDKLVHKLAQLQVSSFVADESPDLDVYGLTTPARSIHLGYRPPAADTAPAEQPPATLQPGDDPGEAVQLLLGAPSDEKDVLYAKRDGQGSVFSITTESIARLGVYPVDPLVFFDRTMLAVSAGSIRRIVLSQNDTTQSVFRVESGQWTVDGAEESQPNARMLETILFLASNLRAVRIVSHNPESLAVYGLDNPPVSVTLGLSGEGGIQKSLMLGFRARSEGLYAMVQGQDVVFVLPSKVVQQLIGDLVIRPPAREE